MSLACYFIFQNPHKINKQKYTRPYLSLARSSDPRCPQKEVNHKRRWRSKCVAPNRSSSISVLHFLHSSISSLSSIAILYLVSHLKYSSRRTTAAPSSIQTYLHFISFFLNAWHLTQLQLSFFSSCLSVPPLIFL